jgi:spore protease
MLERRTDLALEKKELLGDGNASPGVESHSFLQEGYPVHVVIVQNEAGARALGKPVGSYVTLELEGLKRREEDTFGRAVRALAHELGEFSVVRKANSILVVGLGNRAMTPDAIGPLALSHTLVTRHLVEQLPEQFGLYRRVAAVAAGVLGTTGVESGELADSLCRRLKPDLVIAVDALASRSLARVCSTIQIADTGIIPGSGVGNARSALNEQTLGVPVLAIGVPTVVDGATLAADIVAEAGKGELEPEALRGHETAVFVTPRDIDERVADLSKVIGYAVTLALQPHLTLEDAETLLS